MPRIAILGATGSLGSKVALKALNAGEDISVLVRSAARLTPELRSGAAVVEADIHAMTTGALANFVEGHAVLISCAGLVTEGQQFVSLFDRVVTEVGLLAPDARPVCWFMAGAALLDLDGRGRRGVDLPKVKNTYWPHRVNYERLQRSDLDWRLLCPGPMVDQPDVGLDRLRVSIDTLPVPLPAGARLLPAPLLLPLFAARVPEMIIPYGDAAAFMLSQTSPGGALSRKRGGLALPVGMRGKKEQWAAQPKTMTQT
jgi:putative NADH-flavin reductase